MEIADLTAAETDRIIEMAWEDRTPFEAIAIQFGLPEKKVIAIMRAELRPGSFRRWRKRVQGRRTKHLKLGNPNTNRFRSSRQRDISGNRISKRRA